MVRAEREDLQDEQIERALQEVGSLGHGLLSKVERKLRVLLSEVKRRAARKFCAAVGNPRNPLYCSGLHKPTRFTCRDDLRLMTCSTSIVCRVLAAGAQRLSC